MNLDEALHTFIEESRELLCEMEECLLRVEQEAQPQDSINAIFRAAHTIKGSAGLFGLDAVVAFTHVAESLLDEVRAGAVPLQGDLLPLLLRCCDHMHALITAVENKADLYEPALQAHGQALMQALDNHRHSGTAQTMHSAAAALEADSPCSSQAKTWHIAVRFAPTVMQNGMDPLSFLRYLHTLGTVEGTTLLSDGLPNLPDLDAELCYLGFEVRVHTTASAQELHAVFEFVRDDCTLHIAAIDTATQPNCAPAHELPASLSAAIAAAHAATQADTPSAAAHKPAATKARSAEQSTVRVDAHKLDQLINLVGELIIASAGAQEVARQLRAPAAQEAAAAVASLVEEVRDQALQLRMVKIGATFNKFQRVVHDVARELGKDIALHVSGEDAELDKTVVERIGDPLTHLVRNAMDHGIEAVDVRLSRGKPAQGKVSLNAFHESGHIVIEISDDGGGLDRERIIAKGIERGLIEAGRSLSDKEAFALIFEPGFSTAEHITNLSGRGVGMDVVRSNITALRGTIELSSQPGIGTTVQVRLPLTLAIINGFQVRVGHSVFVIPLEMVDECIEHHPTHPGSHHNYTDLRGGVLPYVALREHFALHGPHSMRPNIVVIKHGSQRFGLLVDELLGEAQTVIKPLSKLFGQARGISGSSILGNGNVALILDIPVLHEQLLSTAHSLTPSATAA